MLVEILWTIAILSSSAPIPPPVPPSPPAVDGHGFSISREEFFSAWDALSFAAQADYAIKSDGKAEFLLMYLRDAVLARSARDAGLDADPLVQARIRAATQAVLAQAYLDRELRDPLLSEEALRRQYELVKNDFRQEVWYEARQILVTPRATQGVNNIRKDDAVDETQAECKIKKILKLLSSGVPFEELAKEYSEDPATAAAGGEMGRFKKGAMVDEVETAMDLLQPGEHSGIVRSPYGYHLLKLVRKQTDDPLPLERLRPLLAHRIISGEWGVLMRQENELYEGLKRQYGVRVDWDWIRHLP